MAIYKEQIGRKYGKIPKEYLMDRELSLKERGLLVTLYTLPETWDFSIEGLTTILQDGISCVRNTFQKLVRKGYIVQHRKRDSQGRYTRMDLYVSIHPVMANAPPFDFPQVDDPDTESPDMEKPATEKPDSENHRESMKQKSINKKYNKQKYIPEKKKNAFHNFPQRNYDYEDLEKRLLSAQTSVRSNTEEHADKQDASAEKSVEGRNES